MLRSPKAPPEEIHKDLKSRLDKYELLYYWVSIAFGVISTGVILYKSFNNLSLGIIGFICIIGLINFFRAKGKREGYKHGYADGRIDEANVES